MMKYFIGVVIGFIMIGEATIFNGGLTWSQILLAHLAFAGLVTTIVSAAFAMNTGYEDRIRKSERKRMERTA